MLDALARKVLGVFGFSRQTKTSPEMAHNPLMGERVTGGVPIYDVASMLAPHANIIDYTRQSSAHQGSSGEYTFDTLFMPVIEAYATYAHHLPASESHHHNYPGGLLAHSLQVANRALRYAKAQHLSHVGMLDKEPQRLSRYIYAAWVCGLLHDAGKIYSDIRVIDAFRQNNEWMPLVEDLLSWASRTGVTRYIVKFRKDRTHKRHETVSLNLLQQVLPVAAKKYISTCPDDLFTEMSEALTGYEIRKGFLQDAVRTADRISTAQDLRTIWDATLGPREASLIEQIIKTMQHLMPSWQNHSTPHIAVLANEIYLRWPECLDGIISSMSLNELACPTSAGRLHEAMVERGVIRGHIGERVAHFYEGVKSKEEALEIILGRSAREFMPVVRLEWAFHAVGERVIPPNQTGLLKLTKEGESLLFGGPDHAIIMITLDDVREASCDGQKPENAAAPADQGAAAPTPRSERVVVPAQKTAPQTGGPDIDDQAQLPANQPNQSVTIDLAPSIDEILNSGGKPVKSSILRLAAADITEPEIKPSTATKASKPKQSQKPNLDEAWPEKSAKKGAKKGTTKVATKVANKVANKDSANLDFDERIGAPSQSSVAGAVRRVTPAQPEPNNTQKQDTVATPVKSCAWHRPGESWCDADGYLEAFISSKPRAGTVVVGDAVWLTEEGLKQVFGEDVMTAIVSFINHRYLLKSVALPHLAISQIPKSSVRGIALKPHIAQKIHECVSSNLGAPSEKMPQSSKAGIKGQSHQAGKESKGEGRTKAQDGIAPPHQATALTPKTGDRPDLNSEGSAGTPSPKKNKLTHEEAVPQKKRATTKPYLSEAPMWLATWLGCRMADADIEASERDAVTRALRQWGMQLIDEGALSLLRESEGVILNADTFMAFVDRQETATRPDLWLIMSCMTRCGRTEAAANGKIVIVEVGDAKDKS